MKDDARRYIPHTHTSMTTKDRYLNLNYLHTVVHMCSPHVCECFMLLMCVLSFTRELK